MANTYAEELRDACRDDLQQQIDDLRSQLARYGTHLPTCAAAPHGGCCDCGWAQLWVRCCLPTVVAALRAVECKSKDALI